MTSRRGAALQAFHDRESRALHASAALLSASVLVDSAMEHYRGRFSNRAMYAPLIASALTGLAATRAAASRDDGTHRPRASPYVAALIVASAGLGFHLYNIVKRP